mgnify:CR=1 FL=1
MSLIKKENEPLKWNEKLLLLVTFRWEKLSEEQKQNVLNALEETKKLKPLNS